VHYKIIIVVTRDILAVQQREREGKLREPYIERDVSLKGQGSPLIKVITGPRRAGKSFFAMHVLQAGGHFGYVNFDDERLISLSDYDEVVTAIDTIYHAPRTLLLDEVQNLSKWELFVNRLARQGYDLVITGSNAHLLSSEFSTHLTGRYMETVLFPFSFREYLRWRGTDQTVLEKENALALYARSGGFPEPLLRNLDHRDYLSLLFDSVIYKDIVKRRRVRNPSSIEDLAHYLLSNISTEYSFTTLSRITRVQSVHTVKKYLGYLEEAFLFFSIPRFSYRVREQIAGNRKIYCIDNGFISARAFRHSEDYGHLFENLVAISLRRQELTGNIRLFYWKNAQGEEVDFVVQRGNEVVALIQVCADPTEQKTRDREVRALLKAGRDLSCKALYVLNEKVESVEELEWFGISGTIHSVPLWKWFEQEDHGW